ncbi:MAG TPA: type II toxin-antitoxin system VapC family toxin [Terriglobia bacterium]|nr:type II toxin-antitoxin system VapC family toxin [Terriglobia bacterium]
MRALLDTAVLIWAASSPERITRRARSAMKSPRSVLEFSAVSLSEIAIKRSVGKLDFSGPDVEQALNDLGVRILPYTAEHAFLLFDLPVWHNDPFDRQLVAQALSERIPVVTPDEKFRLYKDLDVIW